MEDLISRQAAIDVIDKIFPADPMRNEYTQGIACGAALAKEWIKSMPSAEPKKGKWRDDAEYRGFHIYNCSECGEKVVERTWNIKKYKHCFHCGAKMEMTE